MRIPSLSIAGAALLLLACSASDREPGNAGGNVPDSVAITLNGKADPVTVLRPFLPETGGLVLERTTFLFSGKEIAGQKYVVPALKDGRLQAVFDTLVASGYVLIDGAESGCEGIKNYENDGYAVSLRYKRSACRTAVNVSFGLEVFIAAK